MVFENGAGLITRDGEKLVVTNLAESADLEEHRRVLQSIFDKLKSKIRTCTWPRTSRIAYSTTRSTTPRSLRASRRKSSSW